MTGCQQDGHICATHGGSWHSGKCATTSVLGMLREERAFQFANYGPNGDIEDGTGPDVQWLTPLTDKTAYDLESALRADYDERGKPTWLRLVREEVAEAFMESDPDRLVSELVQVAALCVSWIEKIQDRQELWQWGVMDGDHIVKDPSWTSAASVLRSAHGFGHGPFQVMVKKPGEDWKSFW